MTRYKLTIYWRNGKTQVQNHTNLFLLIGRVNALRPALVLGYEISVVLETCTFGERQ